jgi:hypothetical protein
VVAGLESEMTQLRRLSCGLVRGDTRRRRGIAEPWVQTLKLGRVGGAPGVRCTRDDGQTLRTELLS